MFDLSLTQQLPAHALASPDFLSSFKTCVQLIVLPFKLEEDGHCDDAIKAHQNAIVLLQKIQKVSGIRKFNRKMYERQEGVHRERAAYLEGMKGRYDEIVKVPSRAAVAKAGSTKAVVSSLDPLSSFSEQSGSSPTEYVITHDSELIDVGCRSLWCTVKDATSAHTLYAAQAIWDRDKPLIECVLRRADGMFPFGEAIHTTLLLQGKPNLNFKLRMQRRGADDGEVWEVPSSTAGKKWWSPRRFSFGGRHFVWKNEDGKDGSLFRKWDWETLYEVRDETEGSEVVGSRLAWGKTQGGFKSKWYLFMVEGLDLALREHILASQLSRYFRWNNPPYKDLSGVEAGARALRAVGAVWSLAEALG
ncbi:hypothetical protein PRZ48_009391 [Zasmidium cellare]|uniref:Uncharacterized protein n=1 Tax=Zasmidium cellare TaxID=395010 RepID=A0ABR0EC93_ZASCE|nr:hypothetical protein PRZ48_009391 [Zasmidium cellare]